MPEQPWEKALHHMMQSEANGYPYAKIVEDHEHSGIYQQGVAFVPRVIALELDELGFAEVVNDLTGKTPGLVMFTNKGRGYAVMTMASFINPYEEAFKRWRT